MTERLDVLMQVMPKILTNPEFSLMLFAAWVLVGMAIGAGLVMSALRYEQSMNSNFWKPGTSMVSRLKMWWYILVRESRTGGPLARRSESVVLRQRLRFGAFFFVAWFLGGMVLFS